MIVHGGNISRRPQPLLIMALITGLAVLGPVGSDQARGQEDGPSLWNRRGEDRNRSPYADAEAKKKDYDKRDIITIEVVDVTDALMTENSRAQREVLFDLSINQWVRLGDDLENAAANTPQIDLETNKETNSRGQFIKRDSLRTHIAATVVDVLPNGHLILEARKKIMLNDNDVEVILSGTVDPGHVDVNKDTIQSDRIADLRIQYIEGGLVASANRRGWLSKIVDLIWPF